MKNIYLIIISLLLLSCSNESNNEFEELSTIDSNIELGQKSSTYYYIINSSSSQLPICEKNYFASPQTQDVELLFNKPLEYDTVLSFSLQEFNYSNLKSLISPWIQVVVKAGDKKVTLDTSCQLPYQFMNCIGASTGTRTKKFRITLLSAKYNGGTSTLEYAPSNNKNYYDINGYLYCLGGGWNDEGGSNPGGL